MLFLSYPAVGNTVTRPMQIADNHSTPSVTRPAYDRFPVSQGVAWELEGGWVVPSIIENNC